MYGFEALTFNIHGGFLEAIVRGHRAGLLTTADYNNLCQCETLDDIKMHLSATEYGPYLQNGAFSPIRALSLIHHQSQFIINYLFLGYRCACDYCVSVLRLYLCFPGSECFYDMAITVFDTCVDSKWICDKERFSKFLGDVM
ncbi:hypothetical protein V8G54_019163 [Vigna mungo]|uniref:Uncharacterized protein n=1 Tax=Vigna mungo TaxID=3915 RepID=A0AAQ3N9Y8_VIGMU